MSGYIYKKPDREPEVPEFIIEHNDEERGKPEEPENKLSLLRRNIFCFCILYW